MAEPTQIVFSYKEVVECLVRKQDIHEGIWGLSVKFAISAANVGPTKEELRPAAIIPLMEIGLQKMEEENNLSVDAAKVNPAPIRKGSSPRAKVKG
jgi:hypothetical protein